MKPGTIVNVAPGLRISFAEDGVFLHVESNGKHGAINLEELGTPAICREAFLAWAHETGSRLSGKTLEEEWQEAGYRVYWSEREPRAYEVRLQPTAFGDCESEEARDEGPPLARLRTVQEVSEWIREHRLPEAPGAEWAKAAASSPVNLARAMDDALDDQLAENSVKPKCEICGDRARIGNDIPCIRCNPEGK